MDAEAPGAAAADGSAAGGGPVVGKEVEIKFENGTRSPAYDLPDELVGTGCFFPTHLGRRGLSEALNHLLQPTGAAPQVFDFLVKQTDFPVDQEQDENEASANHRQKAPKFLRVPLNEYMGKHGLTSEVVITLIYVFARPPLVPENAAEADDWILSVAAVAKWNGALSKGSVAGSISALVGLSNGTVGFVNARDGVARDGLAGSAPSSPSTAACLAAGASGAIISSLRLEEDTNGITALQLLPDEGTGGRGQEFIAASQRGTLFHCQLRHSGGKRKKAVVETDAAEAGDAAEVEVEANASPGAPPSSPASPASATMSVISHGFSDYGGFDSVAADAATLFYAGCSNGKIGVFSAGKLAAPTEQRILGRKRATPSANVMERTGFLEGHTANVSDLVFPEDQPYMLASASLDTSVRVWDTLARRSVATFACDRAVAALTFAPGNAAVLATAHDDGRLRVWDVRRAKNTDPAVATIFNESANVARRTTYVQSTRFGSAVRWHPSNPNLLAAGGHDGAVKVFDIRNPSTAVAVHTTEECKVMCLCWHPLDNDSSRILVGGTDKILKSFCVATDV